MRPVGEDRSIPTELCSEVLVRLASGSRGDELAGELGVGSAMEARSDIILAIPVVVGNMARLADSAVGAIGLLRIMQCQQTDDPAWPAVSGTGSEHPVAADLTSALFSSRSGITDTVASCTGLDVATTETLLAKTAIAVLRSIAAAHDGSLDQATLSAALVEARLSLVEDGWESWMNETIGRGDASSILAFSRQLTLSRPVEPFDGADLVSAQGPPLHSPHRDRIERRPRWPSVRWCRATRPWRST